METLEMLEVAKRFVWALAQSYDIEPVRKLTPRELVRLGRVDFPKENPLSGDAHRVALIEKGGKKFLLYTNKNDTRNFLVGGWELEKVSRGTDTQASNQQPSQSTEKRTNRNGSLIPFLVWMTITLVVTVALVIVSRD